MQVKMPYMEVTKYVDGMGYLSLGVKFPENDGVIQTDQKPIYLVLTSPYLF